MLADMLKYLHELSRATLEPKSLLGLETPRRVAYAVGGRIEGFDLPCPPRNHVVGSLADLIRLANRFQEAGQGGGNDFSPVVWYDSAAVIVVIDDAAHRCERATFTLLLSDLFLRLFALRQLAPWHDQKSFLRLLRVDLAGTGTDVERLIEAARRLRFENGIATTGEVKRQHESLGREITAKVESAAALPEEIAVEVPVYKNMGERNRYPILCAVEVDPALSKLQLLPLPDEIERVQQLAMSSIQSRLDEGLEEGVPAYYGSP